MNQKGLVLDANILLRAVFGSRVRSLLEKYEDVVSFYTPDVCVQDAFGYIPTLSNRRGFDSTLGLHVLEQVLRTVVQVDMSLYEGFERPARERIRHRDPDDWPIVAVALMLSLPVWTEDRDFFGSGIAIWTSDCVEVYLQSPS
jgi:predicted nucleic acid-binding protein